MRCLPSRSVALGIPLTFALPGISPGDVLGALFALILNFISIIVGGIDSAISIVFNGIPAGFGIYVGGINGAFVVMFQGWGQALAAYGLWGPAITVVSLAGAAGVFYMLIGLVDAEKTADDAIKQI